MKRFNLILSVLFFALISLSFVSAFVGGDGTENNPYKISTCLELQSIENNLTADYILVNNINCSNTTSWNGGQGFDPIGTYVKEFSGNLDGKGYIISDLYIQNDSSGTNYIGLFSILGSATGDNSIVSNLGIENINITYNGTSVDVNVGSIAGSLNAKGIIRSSYVTGEINAYRFVGGLVGYNYGNISKSYSNITINAGQNYVGGIVGINDGGIVNNTYSIGNVTGVIATGGIFGAILGGSLINSYSIGNISGSAGYVGGLIGYESLAGTISNCFWDLNTSNQLTSVGGTGKNTSKMKTESTFTGFDFTTTWDIAKPDLIDYPFLRFQEFSGGEGISSNPYKISTCLELQSINNGTSLYYKLIKEVDCSNTKTWNSGAGFISIGNDSNRFSGYFNGDGYKVKNLFINRSSLDNQGLFGYSTGNLTKLGLENINITGRYFVGGLSGTSGGNISYSYSTNGTVIGKGMVGGLVGRSISPSILSNVYSTLNVTETNNTGTNVGNGGLIGFSFYSDLINCYAFGNVSGLSGYSRGLLYGVDLGLDTYSFWDTQTSNQLLSSKGTGKTTAQMKTQSTFTNWDFVNIWKKYGVLNSGYPYLTYFATYFLSPTTSGNLSQDSIKATIKSRISNLDTINITLYNSSGIVYSNTSTDEYFSYNFTGLTNGIYYLNATANDTSNNLFPTGTKTITLDTVSPTIKINEPNGTKNSLDVDYNVSLSDNFGNNLCKYWVTRGGAIEISNVTVTCSSEVTSSISLTLNALYVFHFYALDNAGNSNYLNSSFTISTGIGGGGGGGEEIIVEVPVYSNKTFCGDLICQTPNDFGVIENYWNCNQDCPGAIGENLDELVYSISKYCFDGDPSTVCFFTQQLFSTIPGPEDELITICGDDLCEGKESVFSCPTDCGTFKEKIMDNLLIILLGILGIVFILVKYIGRVF